MCAFIAFLHQSLYLIPTDIFTRFAENVYGSKNMHVKNFVLILKNNMAAMADCMKIIDLFANLK